MIRVAGDLSSTGVATNILLGIFFPGYQSKDVGRDFTLK